MMTRARTPRPRPAGLRAVSLGLLLLAACAPPAAEAPRPEPVLVAAAPPAREQVDSPPVADRDVVAERLCRERRPCRLLRVHDAGKDEEGRALAVGLLHLGPQPQPGEAPPEPTSDEGGWRIEGDADLFEPTGHPCQRYEYGVVVFDGGAVARTQRLVEICNDGHGSAGVGEDQVTVSANRFVYQIWGGSAWRWARTVEAQLSPPAVLSEHDVGDWTLGSNHEERRWSWSPLGGTSNWGSPVCSAPDGPAPSHQGWLLPQLALDAPFTDSAWTTTPLGGCSLRVTGGEAGVLLGGGTADRADASVAAVVDTQQRLYVEVLDDHFTAAGAKVEDRLELWLTSSSVSYADHCIDPSALTLQAMAVTMSRSPAATGMATPTGLTVAWAPPQPGVRRLRFTLPSDTQALTLIYRDSDDGQIEERAIATSAFEPNDARSLGRLERIGQDRARCGIVAGRLEPRMTRSIAADEPLLP